MSCFGNRVTSDIYQNCCCTDSLCEFDGDMSCVSSAPLYVQQVFDAVKFNLQGMKTFNEHSFSPCIPPGHRIKRVIDIRCRRVFNPENVDDCRNLTLEVDTSISGASFLKDCKGDYLSVIGADGTYSERIMYAETSDCDEKGMGTPVFGTQCVSIYGNVVIELDLLLCDNCGNETCFTIGTEVCIADCEHPMVLTNFFEICMPSAIDTAFLPRFTEFCNSACEARLATNNCGRDLSVNCCGEVTGNLIVAICLTCEKKIVVPVQLCVLTTGYVDAPLQQNAVCTTFPSLFPGPVKECEKEHKKNCAYEEEKSCLSDDCCNPCEPAEPCDPCGGRDCCNPCEPPKRPQPRR